MWAVVLSTEWHDTVTYDVQSTVLIYVSVTYDGSKASDLQNHPKIKPQILSKNIFLIY